MKRLFRDASIQTKLMISHVILIAIPTIVIMMFFYTQFYNMVVSDSIRQALALSRQTASALDATLNQISTIQSTIGGSNFTKRIFSGSMSQNSNASGGSEISDLEDFKHLIDSEIDGNFIKSIHIYTDQAPDRYYNSAILNDIFLPADDAKGTYWHGIFSSSTKYHLYCPSFYLSNTEIDSYGPLAYIEKFFPDDNSEIHTPSYLAIYFSADNLTSILKQDNSVNQGIYYIINERNSIITSSDSSQAGNYFMDYDTVCGLSSSDEGFTIRTVLGKRVYTVSYPIGDTDWYMVSVLPASQVLHKSHILIASFLALYLLLLIVAFIIAYRLSSSITKRMGIINNQMRITRKEPPIRIPVPTIHDEIGELADSYNYMADRINSLIKHQKKAAEDLRFSEVNALQSQINPHFLYNTMDMINWLSQTGKSQEVTDAIQALSRFYKLTLSSDKLFGSVSSEIEHVTLYIQLQNMRYENTITFLTDIPDELLSQPLPKLTLQPIIENSILHGILEKSSRSGTIILTGWQENHDLVLLVSDDGVGISEDILKTILQGTQNNSSSGNNIAVHNTHKRLQLLYGKLYGLTYRSTINEGTEVEIRVPMT